MDADPLVELSGVTIVEADRRHAVARQEGGPELDNHARLRHAGALFAAGYAASRALVEAALGPRASELELRIDDSEVSYDGIVRGGVTATAEPAGEDWEAALAGLDEGRDAELRTAVQLRSDAGATTTTISVLWRVGRKLQPGT
jgi:acyl-coenzyme A thioesterase PaaI-like protein